MSELAESDRDVYGGDREDNLSIESDNGEEARNKSMSLDGDNGKG